MIKKNVFLVFLVIVMGISLLGCTTDSIDSSIESIDTVDQESEPGNIDEPDASDETSDILSTESVDSANDESETSDEISDIKSISVKAKNLAGKAKNLMESLKEDVETSKIVESEEDEVDIEVPKDFTVSISVERTGNIVTNRSKLHVLIDGEEAFTVRGNSTEGANMILSKGIHTIQVKGQGDKSKKLEFNVTEDSPNYFYFWAEISNWWGIKLERRTIN